jgi:hypothetical protein
MEIKARKNALKRFLKTACDEFHDQGDNVENQYY